MLLRETLKGPQIFGQVGNLRLNLTQRRILLLASENSQFMTVILTLSIHAVLEKCKKKKKKKIKDQKMPLKSIPDIQSIR